MDYIKYPRTEHLLGSKFLDLDNFNLNFQDKEGLACPSLKNNQHFIIEEKMDGIGLGILFIDGLPHIQQRGHIFPLQEIPDLLKNFKSWVIYNEEMLYCMIGENYTLFGEWLEFKHTVFYNQLISPFLEYDIFDQQNNNFLSTTERYKIINQQLQSVKVILQTSELNLPSIKNLLLNNVKSHFNNEDWSADFKKLQLKFPKIHEDTVKNAGTEGFYIKVENEQQTLQRYKWIRKEFFDIVVRNQHWKDKPIIRNIIQQQQYPLKNSI